MHRRRWMFTILCLAALAGCGSDGDPVAPVRGKVTVGGAPVTTGVVMFWPDDGRAPATGQIQPDGTYELETQQQGKGAVIGSHVVTIKAVEIEGGAPKSFEEERSLLGGAGAPKTTWLVPPRYQDQTTSGLTAQVTEQENTINFDLPAEK